MIRSMIKKALGIEANRPSEKPNFRPASQMGGGSQGGGSGLVRMGKKPGTAPREGLALRAPDQDVTEWYQKAVNENPVLIFMKGTPTAPQCGFSAKVADIFKQTGVPFESYNILEDGGVRGGVKEINNWPTIPQIVVKGEFIGGCDIVTQMAMSGELQTLLSTIERGDKN